MLFQRAALIAALCSVCVTSAQINIFEDDEARLRLVELTAQLEQLEATVQELSLANSRLNTEKQELLDLVRELTGLIDTASNTTSQQNLRLDELKSRLETQLKDFDAQIGSDISKLSKSLDSSDSNLYQQALTNYKRTDMAAAADLLRRLLRRYPTSGYAHAAYYWLAEIAWEQGNTESARGNLIELLTMYPDSTRIPDALLLLNKIALTRDDTIEAEHWSRQLLERYPSSSAADRHQIAPDS